MNMFWMATLLALAGGGERHVLLIEAVTKGSNLSYELSISPTCNKDGCPYEVRLLDGRKALGTVIPFEGIAAEPGKPSHDKVSVALGTEGFKGSGWTSGEENSMTEIAARPVQLSQTARGLLVHIAFGFEHVHRRHTLVAAVDGKPRIVWSGYEGAGPAFSTVDVLDSDKNGTDELLYNFQFHYADDTTPNDWSMTALVWDEAKKKMVKHAPPRYWAVVASRHKKLPDAVNLRDGNECLSSFLVIETAKGLPGIRGPYVIAHPARKRSDAESAAAELRKCDKNAKIKLLPVGGK